MSTITISKSLFKKMITNGAINLKNNQSEIDHLNVFPVPDGDTGTNMQMTMMAGIKEILDYEKNNESFSDISKILSRGLLMGARGNSGVILSQFFRGFHMALETIIKDEITVSELISALTNGYKMAYKAVQNPVEGTILTVVKIAADAVRKNKKNLKTIEETIELYLKVAKETLEKTPDLLPQLKEAGVVDSGGAGFIKIIEGMQMALRGEMLKDESKKDFIVQKSFDFKDNHKFSNADIKYGYCTEFIVKLFKPKNFKEEKVVDVLKEIGDSMVVAVVDDLFKVHVHTNQPGIVITLAQKYGDLQTIKVENMRLQNEKMAAEEKKEKPKDIKKYGIISVCSGSGISDLFKDAGCDIVINGGQTMNPSTQDFISAINKLNAEHIIIIPNNSNIIMAAEQTKQIFPDKDIQVIKTKNLGQGFAAIMVFDELSDIDLNYETMHEAIKEANTAEITYSVRDTSINGVEIKKDNFIGICNGEIKVCENNKLDAYKNSLKEIFNKDKELLTVFYGKDLSEEEIKEVENYTYSEYSNLECEFIKGDQDIYSFIMIIE